MNSKTPKRPTTRKSHQKLQRLLTDIAREEMRIETLETRFSDSLDFHDVGVSSLKRALEAAYHAGVAAASRWSKK